MRAEQLQRIINQSTGEREVAQFLALHPEIVRYSVTKTAGHSAYVLKEFPFGSHYKADLVVLTSYSGVWEVHLIELEPPDDMVVTKDDIPSNRLNKALTQLNDWKDYIDKNRIQFRCDLTTWCMSRDLLKWIKGNHIPSNNTGDLLNSPDTMIKCFYYVFIGNREKISKDARRRMNLLSNYPIQILTYGRFLDVAKNFDEFDADNSKNVLLTKSEE